MKQINFMLPVFYKSVESRQSGCPAKRQLRWYVLLSKLKSNKLKYINVELETGNLDLTAAESKVIYEEIKDYVLK